MFCQWFLKDALQVKGLDINYNNTMCTGYIITKNALSGSPLKLRQIFHTALMVLSCKFAFAQASGKPAHPDPVKNPNIGVLLIDADTDKVLYEYKSNTRFQPASMTKMMTAYLTFQALEEGKITLDQKLPISARAAAQQYKPELRAPSKKGVSKISTRDALNALMVPSSNDAAFVLAENVGGTLATFVFRMNATAKKLGMHDTKFTNPSGWEFPRQYSTPHDMALLLKAVIRDYPQYYADFFGNSAVKLDYNNTTYQNHNRLQRPSMYLEGMDGGKTGFFRTAGYNLAASAVRDGHRLIGVVQKATHYTTRDPFFARLMEYGFLTYHDPSLTFPMDKATIDSLKTKYNGKALPVLPPPPFPSDSTETEFIIPNISELRTPAQTQDEFRPRGTDTRPTPLPARYEAVLRRNH